MSDINWIIDNRSFREGGPVFERSAGFGYTHGKTRFGVIALDANGKSYIKYARDKEEVINEIRAIKL